MSERLRKLTYIPDGVDLQQAFARAEVLVIGAHSDDVEVLGLPQAVEGMQRRDFFAVCVTDGTGCPKTGPYGHCTPEEIREIRREEQKKAADEACYSGVTLLQYSSADVRDASRQDVADDLLLLIDAIRPRTLITHNLFDRHPTHIGVAMRVIQALRKLSDEYVPERFLGMEVWNSLDWVPCELKVRIDASAALPYAESILNVFQSQIDGGKAYQKAVPARWTANATFQQHDEVDQKPALALGVDMSAVIQDCSVEQYVAQYLRRFADGVRDRILPCAPEEFETEGQRLGEPSVG